MTHKQVKAMKLSVRIKKLIFSHLDDNNLYRATGVLLDRLNSMQSIAFPELHAKPLTPGECVDDWYETRVFESNL